MGAYLNPNTYSNYQKTMSGLPVQYSGQGAGQTSGTMAGAASLSKPQQQQNALPPPPSGYGYFQNPATGQSQIDPYGTSTDPYGYMADYASQYPLAPNSPNYSGWQQLVKQETGTTPTTTALTPSSPNYAQVQSLNAQGVYPVGTVGTYSGPANGIGPTGTGYAGTGSSTGTSASPGTGSYNNPITAGVVSPPGQIGNTVSGAQVPAVPMTAAQAMSLASQQNSLEGQLNQSNNVNLGLTASQQLANLMNQVQGAQQNQGISNTELAAGQYGNSLQQQLQNAQLQSQLWQSNVGLQNQSLGQANYLAPLLQNLFGGTGVGASG